MSRIPDHINPNKLRTSIKLSTAAFLALRESGKSMERKVGAFNLSEWVSNKIVEEFGCDKRHLLVKQINAMDDEKASFLTDWEDKKRLLIQKLNKMEEK